MTIHATVTIVENRLVAFLSDGRKLDGGDFRTMANVLYRAGVPDEDVQYCWSEGHRMITAGQQVALRAELSRLKNELPPH